MSQCFRNNTSTLASDLAKIALQVADELYWNVMGKQPAPRADLRSTVEDLVAEMLYCYLESIDCNLFRAASAPGTKLIHQILSLYVGVPRSPSIATSLTGQLMALLTGEGLYEMNETTCHENHLAWMAGYNFTGLCINSTVNYSIAVSPAFIIEGRCYSIISLRATLHSSGKLNRSVLQCGSFFFVTGYDMKSGVYSTWTESIWQTLSVRMFLKPSAATERFSMILGSLVAGTSFALVWFINTRADVLFNSRFVHFMRLYMKICN